MNVSIDSLQRDRFYEHDPARLAARRCCAGWTPWPRQPELRPVKVNAVAMRGFTEQEALPFAEFAREHDFQVRFIEFMPLDGDHAWSARPGAHRRGAARRSSTPSTRWRSCRASPRPPRGCSASPTAAGEIGFVNPVSEPFCADCNRIRLTAEGKLRTCLFSLHETDLREPAARRAPTTTSWRQIVRDAVWRKELKHHVGEPGFRQPPRTMSAIGG